MKCKFNPCGNEVPPNKIFGVLKRYCSRACINKDGVNRLRRRRKQEAVDYKGGKCERCGFDEHIAALQFHHQDPSKKDFTLSRGINLALAKIKIELDKCIMLCANCHSITHALLAQTVERGPEEPEAGGSTPSESTNSTPIPEHGTRTRYSYYKCRCVVCCKSQSEYMAKYRLKKSLTELH